MEDPTSEAWRAIAKLRGEMAGNPDVVMVCDLAQRWLESLVKDASPEERKRRLTRERVRRWREKKRAENPFG